MAGDAAAAARSFDEQLAAAVARAQSAVSAAEAPEKTDEQIVEAIASAEAAAEANGIAPATRYAIDRVKIKWQRFVERFAAAGSDNGSAFEHAEELQPGSHEWQRTLILSHKGNQKMPLLRCPEDVELSHHEGLQRL